MKSPPNEPVQGEANTENDELDLCADQKYLRMMTKDLTLADLDNQSDGSSSGLSDTSDEEYNPEPARFGYKASKEI